MKESPCRPDAHHWCNYCCEQVRCCLLNTLPDGSIGCVGHIELDTCKEIPQRPICQDLDCLSGYFQLTDTEQGLIIDLIKTLPHGQFQMPQVIKYFNNEIG